MHQKRYIFLWIFSGIIGLFLLAPTLVVIPMAFNESATLGVFTDQWTFKWFVELFGSATWGRALMNSAKVSIAVVGLAGFLGTLAAWGLSRIEKFRTILRYGMIAPVIVPPIIIGVGLFIVFLKLDLVGTTFGLILAHTLLALPFVIIAVGAGFAQLDPIYERAAASLGANRYQQFTRIVLPLILPSVISGSVFAFIISWDEVVVSIFLTDAATRTLPVEMWNQTRTQLQPTLAAIGACLLLLSSSLLLVTEVLRRRKGK